MTTDVQARLLALTAYRVGRESVARGHCTEHSRLIRNWLNQLEGRPQTEETLRRRVFYTLVLAELHRSSEPMPYREAAMELSERLDGLGAANPFPHYMRIMTATTRQRTTGNFGDLRTAAVDPIQTTASYTDHLGNVVRFDPALSAAGLHDADLREADWFTKKPLYEIARHHGLA